MFLVVVFCLAVILPWLAGGDFYLRGIAQRPFHPLFHLLKPSGRVGHMYGIVGSVMILAGVVIYSGRKRIRRFADAGKMKVFLQVHTALCLVGPALIVFHATFKTGGLAGIGFWSMMAVVASGFVGRYLWIQIPKGIEGHAIPIGELEYESERLLEHLEEHHQFSPEQIRALDRMIDAAPPSRNSIAGTLRAVVWHDLRYFARRRTLTRWLSANGVTPDHMAECVTIAGRRSVLRRRILFLEQLHRIFRYWHVIHLPFTYILLVTFLVHVAAAFLFGYLWGG